MKILIKGALQLEGDAGFSTNDFAYFKYESVGKLELSEEPGGVSY